MLSLIHIYGYICVDIKNLVKDFQTHHPQNFSGVPLVVETIYKRVWKTARKTGREEVLKKGIKISRFLLKFGIDVRRKLFAQVHEQLGGNLKYLIVGGAALDPEYEQGLYDLGIQVLNGYGITECSPAVTTNTMENHKSGSVGRPLPCNEIKINDPDEDGVGEIYVRGSNVMRGYYKDPEATAAAFDNGWFKTGDYGRIDAVSYTHLDVYKRQYVDCVTEFDYYLGKLFDTLEELGVMDNTIIVFTSDNGPALQGSTGDLRGGKYLAYEGGQKVPFMIRWGNNGGLFKAGSTYDESATLVDLFPTLVEMCGITGNGGTEKNYLPADRVIAVSYTHLSNISISTHPLTNTSFGS